MDHVVVQSPLWPCETTGFRCLASTRLFFFISFGGRVWVLGVWHVIMGPIATCEYLRDTVYIVLHFLHLAKGQIYDTARSVSTISDLFLDCRECAHNLNKGPGLT